jgi:hypothetical protein
MGQVIYRELMRHEQEELMLPASARIVSVVHGDDAGYVELLVLRSTDPAVPVVARRLSLTGSATEVDDRWSWVACTTPSWDTGAVLHLWEIR